MGDTELRLATEEIGWLTTVGPRGELQSSPVWFVWEDGSVFVASEPTADKIANLRANPNVSFHVDGAAPGQMVVTIEGRADLAEQLPTSYIEKYRSAFDRLGGNAPDYVRIFSAVVRITPTRIRSFLSI